MRGLLCLILMLGVLGRPTLARACKCGKIDERELAEHYVVFVGTAVEYLQRKDHEAEQSRPSRRVNAATRFEVLYSRDVPMGSSVTVAMDIYSSCSTFFEVGDRYLVAAFKQGELLFVSECPLLGQELETTLLAHLGVPAGFLQRPSPSPVPTLGRKILDASYFAAADAALARYVHSLEAESAHELRRTAPPREGSCAACALTPAPQPTHLAWLAITLAFRARRQRARATSRRCP